MGVFAIVVLSSGLETWGDRIVFGGIGIIVFAILGILISERLRRSVQGFYTYLRGGAEDGDLVYVERGNKLRLYFQRPARTIYVPSDSKWVEMMPDWAKQRRDVIMNRIRGDIGKHWRFVDTDNIDRILTQS